MHIADHLAEHEAVLVSISRKTAYRYRLGRHAWKDLAQEAREELIEAHEHRRYDHDRASLLIYAWRGVHWRIEHVAQDMIGRTDPADGLLFDELADTVEAESVTLRDPELQWAFEQLDEAEQTTLRLYAIHPALKDAAKAAKLSVPTFRKRQLRGTLVCMAPSLGSVGSRRHGLSVGLPSPRGGPVVASAGPRASGEGSCQRANPQGSPRPQRVRGC